MSNLLAANSQWSSRPADERFWNLRDLQQAMSANRADVERKSDIRTMKAKNVDGNVCLVGAKGEPTRLNHWSFGQLSLQCDAPAGYLRGLPADLVVANINHGLQTVGEKDSQVKLLLKKTDHWMIRAITGPDYGRIWNSDVVHGLMPALEKGWMTPPARPAVDDPRARAATALDIVPGQEDFGLSVKIGDKIAPAGVYAGDRDMFVFLVNPDRMIDDGNQGLMRGVFVWNSEVGGGAFKVQTFYLENVCGNHIVWGASGLKEIKIVHRKNAIVGFDQKTMRQLDEYAHLSASKEEGLILAARQHVLGKDEEEITEKLYGIKPLGLTKKDIKASFEMAVMWEKTAKSAPTTLWGFVHGLTRYSQNTGYADQRTKLDTAAGKLLELSL